MDDGKCKKSVGGVRDDVLDITDGVNTICDAFQHLLKKQMPTRPQKIQNIQFFFAKQTSYK